MAPWKGGGGLAVEDNVEFDSLEGSGLRVYGVECGVTGLGFRGPGLEDPQKGEHTLRQKTMVSLDLRHKPRGFIVSCFGSRVHGFGIRDDVTPLSEGRPRLTRWRNSGCRVYGGVRVYPDHRNGDRTSR